MIARYDTSRSWQWNLDNSPEPLKLDHQAVNTPLAGDWSWCGISVDSPLGIPAGPLLDGRWLLYYASLGFDVLVYKTVRSCARECYALPNLVPVDTGPLTDAGMVLQESTSMRGSWAVSFGMPSQSPDIWRRDVELTRQRIPKGKVLVVSVVGTQDITITDPQASLELLAADFARCAKWAAESGAHGIEANFSCPNVSTADGQLFQQATAAACVAERIRSAIGTTPLVIKIGRMATRVEAESLIYALNPFINGLAMTNSIAARVQRNDQSLQFDGQLRGICGDATRAASVEQVRLFADIVAKQNLPLQLIGVGGISTADHVRNYLNAGASSVALATSAMVDPKVGMRIRQTLELSGETYEKYHRNSNATDGTDRVSGL